MILVLTEEEHKQREEVHTRDRRDLDERIRVLEQELLDNQSRYRGQIDDLKRQLGTAQDACEIAEKQKMTAFSSQDKAQTELRVTRDHLETTRKQCAEAVALKTEAVVKHQVLSKVHDELVEREKAAEDLRKRTFDTNLTLSRDNNNLQRVLDVHKADLKLLQAQYDVLTSERDGLREAKDVAEAKLKATKGQVSSLKGRLTRATR